MTAFFTSFASYLIKMIILIAIGLAGGFIGVKLRQASDRKAGASVEQTETAEKE